MSEKLFKWEYHITGSKECTYHSVKEEITGRTIALLYDKDLTSQELEKYGKLIASAPNLREKAIDAAIESCEYKADWCCGEAEYHGKILLEPNICKGKECLHIKRFIEKLNN